MENDFFKVYDLETGEFVELHNQNFSKEEQMEKAKEFLKSRAENDFWHPTKESIVKGIGVNTNDEEMEQEMEQEINEYIEEISRLAPFQF